MFVPSFQNPIGVPSIFLLIKRGFFVKESHDRLPSLLCAVFTTLLQRGVDGPCKAAGLCPVVPRVAPKGTAGINNGEGGRGDPLPRGKGGLWGRFGKIGLHLPEKSIFASEGAPFWRL
jgi:hypothetical protein